jgi:hypothetical protein
VTRLFITQYRCTTCDFLADRPSAFIAHYRYEHGIEVTFTLDPAEPAKEASACRCRFTHEGWVNTLCPRHQGDDEQ